MHSRIFSILILATMGINALPISPPATITDDYDPNPHYVYGYDIEDTLTGDSKTHKEQRIGDVVKGVYSFIEPGGIKRIVEYTADPEHGFNAVIHRELADKKF